MRLLRSFKVWENCTEHARNAQKILQWRCWGNDFLHSNVGKIKLNISSFKFSSVQVPQTKTYRKFESASKTDEMPFRGWLTGTNYEDLSTRRVSVKFEACLFTDGRSSSHFWPLNKWLLPLFLSFVTTSFFSDNDILATLGFVSRISPKFRNYCWPFYKRLQTVTSSNASTWTSCTNLNGFYFDGDSNNKIINFGVYFIINLGRESLDSASCTYLFRNSQKRVLLHDNHRSLEAFMELIAF